MSSSIKQLNANRANAKSSTGPRTEAGKSRSRLNALKHGLSAKALIIVGECADGFLRNPRANCYQLTDERQ